MTAGVGLSVRGLRKSFYGVHALDGVAFEVKAGELLGLIGPNGSGKTTAIDCIAGLQRADAGAVELDDASIRGAPAHRLAHLGVVRTFQDVRVFTSLSVRRNLRVAALGRLRPARRLRSVLRRDLPLGELEERIDRVLDSLGLGPVADRRAGELSYGQRKLVEFAAACVIPPRLLLLDEPIAAVNPTIANTIRKWILDLHGEGVSMLLVEHNIDFVVGTCQRMVVLDHGAVIAEGAPREVIKDPQVQEAYFGR